MYVEGLQKQVNRLLPAVAEILLRTFCGRWLRKSEIQHTTGDPQVSDALKNYHLVEKIKCLRGPIQDPPQHNPM